MPSAFTHAAVGLGLARLATPRPMPAAYWLLAAGLAVVPDLDVVAFAFGIPYGARLGHRGLFHSLFCALVVSWVAAMLAFRHVGLPWWGLWGVLLAATASHGLLDAFTNGGMGIALLAPFDPTRYFFPWQPIQVSPIGREFFSRWGLRALASEIVWVWLPLGLVLGATEAVRAFTRPALR